MCGEKSDKSFSVWSLTGSPPHVRGKGAGNAFTSSAFGITPACAGKSVGVEHDLSVQQDHPRMCGEKN